MAPATSASFSAETKRVLVRPLGRRHRASSAEPRSALEGLPAGGGEGGVGHQTFSTSGRPRRPVGRKIRTIARIEKAATSLYSIEK